MTELNLNLELSSLQLPPTPYFDCPCLRPGFFWLILFSLPGDPLVTKSQSGAIGKGPGLEEQEVYDEACLCSVTLESSQCFSELLPT